MLGGKSNALVFTPEKKGVFLPHWSVQQSKFGAHWPELGHTHIPEPTTVGEEMDPAVGFRPAFPTIREDGWCQLHSDHGDLKENQVCLG